MKFKELNLKCLFVLMICLVQTGLVLCEEKGDDYDTDVGSDSLDLMPAARQARTTHSVPRKETDEDGPTQEPDKTETVEDVTEEEAVKKDNNTTRFKFDPRDPKNVALLYWGPGYDPSKYKDTTIAPDVTTTPAETTPDSEFVEAEIPGDGSVTVGAFIAINVVVCIPSAQIPIRIHNTSNWYVFQVSIGDPPTMMTNDEYIVIYHPKFEMGRDSPHRIAMVVFNKQGEITVKAMGMTPLMLTAIPFLPTVMHSRTDDYALTMCTMVSYAGDGYYMAIPFVVTACRYLKEAKAVFAEKVCGYTKMMKKPTVDISSGLMYPDEMGSPLVCGNVLVGIYSGIQNVKGNRYGQMTPGAKNKKKKGHPSGQKRMKDGEQYTFEIPGGLNNFAFLGAFVNHTAKNMSWSMKIEMEQTNECADIDVNVDEETEDDNDDDDDDNPGLVGQPAPGEDEASHQRLAAPPIRPMRARSGVPDEQQGSSVQRLAPPLFRMP